MLVVLFAQKIRFYNSIRRTTTILLHSISIYLSFSLNIKLNVKKLCRLSFHHKCKFSVIQNLLTPTLVCVYKCCLCRCPGVIQTWIAKEQYILNTKTMQENPKFTLLRKTELLWFIYFCSATVQLVVMVEFITIAYNILYSYWYGPAHQPLI